MNLRYPSAAVLVCLVGVGLSACRTSGTYSERGEYVEMMKDLLEQYSAGEWYAYSAFYSDSALVFVNSTDPMTMEERIASLQAQRALFDDISVSEPLFGEVHNTDGDVWVLVWGSWVGRVRGSEWQVSAPVHIAARIVDGKVDQEWVYMDQSPLDVAALQAAVLDAVSVLDSTDTSDQVPDQEP